MPDGQDGSLHREKCSSHVIEETYLEPADVKSPHMSELG